MRCLRLLSIGGTPSTMWIAAMSFGYEGTRTRSRASPGCLASGRLGHRHRYESTMRWPMFDSDELSKTLHALLTGYPDRAKNIICLLYTSPSPRDGLLSRMPSSA